MFLSQPEPTPLDVRFRLFGTPIRIHPFFWLVGALVGYYYLSGREMRIDQKLGLGFLAFWLGWLLVSVMIHEFGHITAARAAGRRGRIVLHYLGGLAIWDTPADYRWRRMMIAAAGPAAGFLFWAAVLLVQANLLPRLGLPFLGENPTVVLLITEGLEMLFWLNLILNLMNLVPIWPLDGGQITLELFSGISPTYGHVMAFGLSILLAGAGAAYSVFKWSGAEVWYPRIHPGFAAALLGLMAFQNFMMLIEMSRARPAEDA